MANWVDGTGYRRGLGLRFGSFAVVTLLFPLFVVGIVELLGARGIGGAAGAVAVVLGVYLKPVIYLWFTYSTLRPSLGRARSLGLSPMVGLCIPLLLLADLGFGLSFGAFWGVGFVFGILNTPFPGALLTALAAGLTLSLLQEVEGEMGGRLLKIYSVWKGLLYLSAGLGLMGVLPILLAWLVGGAGLMLLLVPIQLLALLKLTLVYPFGLLLAFVAVSVMLVQESQRSPPGGTDRKPPMPRREGPLFGARKA